MAEQVPAPPNSNTPIADTLSRLTADLATLPPDVNRVMVTARSDWHGRHTVAVAAKVGEEWVLGAALEKTTRQRPDTIFTLGASWRAK